MSVKGLVKQVLTEKENRRYERRLQHRKVSYGEWVTELEAQEVELWAKRQGGTSKEEPSKEEPSKEVPSKEEPSKDMPSKEVPSLEELSREESFGEEPSMNELSKKEFSKEKTSFVVVIAGEGQLAPDGLENIERYFIENPEVQLLYGDEDVCGEFREGVPVASRRRAPWFKPDWSPDLWNSFFYFGSVIALREELFQRVKALYGEHFSDRVQQFFKIYEKAYGKTRKKQVTIYQSLDFFVCEKWVDHCVDMAGGYLIGSRTIGHLRRIMFHSVDESAQEIFLQPSPFRRDSQKLLLMDFRDNWISAGKRREAAPVLSVVIPSKDQPALLERCLKGCIKATLPMELIVVDNGSSPENRQQLQGLFQRLLQEGHQVTWLYEPMDFNFSKMCNLGAAQAQGEFLLFLNDDVELCQPEALKKMAALTDRDFTGAVGLKLYYPDSVRIQHAGITNLPMGPVHKLQFKEDNTCYYYGTNRGRRNVLAVTAACLMVEKKKYLEAGGFSEELPVAFNDVDFCFRLHELGYWNVCVNDSFAYHHESLSRGADESPEKLERLFRERRRLYERHPDLEGTDPFYSPYLNREGLDTGIRPAYLTAGNRVQRVEEPLRCKEFKGYRRDDCLMVRIEDCREGRVLGYGVVLGDDNACYEKELLLWKAGESDQGAEAAALGPTGQDQVFYISLIGQYRPDLEENMPDQVRVALSGLDVKLGAGAVPAGRYRLGMTARNRVTGLKLINWSNRWVSLGRAIPE